MASLVSGAAGSESDGTLDTFFGDSGLVRTVFFPPPPAGGTIDVANAVGIQPDGKIVVGAETYDGDYEFALARYLPIGDLDPDFGGGDGLTVLEASGDVELGEGHDDVIADIAIQPDGKIVAVGRLEPVGPKDEPRRMGTDFAVARFNPDGSPDPLFGVDGVVATDIDSTGIESTGDYASSLALQPDGKIVVGGSATDSNGDFALARYNTDGSADNSFSVDGKLRLDVSAWKDHEGADSIAAVGLAPDGDIIAAGTAQRGEDDFEIAVARFGSDGALDTSFGSNGLARLDLANREDIASDLVVGGDGSMVLAITRVGEPPTCDAIGVLALTAAGKLKTDFGSGGWTTTEAGIDSCDKAASAMAVQTNGKILVGSGNETDFAIVRYTPSGGLDPTFAGDGVLTLRVDGDAPYIVSRASTVNDLTIDSLGRIVAVGSSKPGGVWSEATVARFTNACDIASRTASGAGRRLVAVQRQLKRATANQQRGKARFKRVQRNPRASVTRKRKLRKGLRQLARRVRSLRRAAKRAQVQHNRNQQAAAVTCGTPYPVQSLCERSRRNLRIHSRRLKRLAQRVRENKHAGKRLRNRLRLERRKRTRARRSVHVNCGS